MKTFLFSLVIAPLLASPILGQCGTAYRSRVVSYSSYSYATPTYSTYVAPAVVKKEVAVVEKVVTPVFLRYVAVIPFVEVPSYGAQYAPQQYPALPQYNGQPQQQQAPNPAAQSNGQSSELRQVLNAVQGITDTLRAQDARIRDIEEYLKRTPIAPKAIPKEKAPEPKREESSLPDVRQIAAKKCAACHAEGNEAGGGKFVLLDKAGNLLTLKTDNLLSMSEHVYAGTMPPKTSKAKAVGVEPLTDQEAGAFMAWIASQRKRPS